MEYKFNELEEKWKQFWAEKGIYQITEDTSKPKYYVLDMFPYPSGAGLHVGHPLGYVASDIYARYKRLKGFNVLHPMGYDAFGLPAEQYAIETGTHPAITTEKAIKRYREQLDKIGFSFDWSRQVKTCEPDYYKWTQWIFLQLFNSWYNREHNKAEKIETLISGFEKWGCSKEWKQFDETLHPTFSADDWKAFSTKQKERILQCYRLAYRSYTEVNWCDALGCVLANDEVKDGKSERGGYPVTRKKMRQWSLRITEYADRLLEGLNRIDWSDSLKEQQRNWIGRSEGASLQFPVSGLQFALEVFTTRVDTLFGATFLVVAPEHEFIQQLITNEQRAAMDAYLAYVGSRSDIERQQEKRVTGEFTGSYAVHPFTGKQIPIYTAEYVLAGYGTGAIMAVPADDERDRKFAEKFGLPIIDIVDKSMYPGATIEDKKGKMINSDFLDGMEVVDAIAAMIDKVEEMGIGKRQVNYKLRDASYSRQRYWGEPFPIRYEVQGDVDSPFVDDNSEDEADIPVALKPEELHLVQLPAVDSFKPTGDGRSPLANNADWVKNRFETDTMPGYAGSSWYYLRYMDPKNPDAFAAKDKLDYWQNVDIYFGGAEHAVGHLLYSRFWHKVLFDLGFVSTDEPFKKLVNQGMIQGVSAYIYRVTKDEYAARLLTNFLSENGVKYEEISSANRTNFPFMITSLKSTRLTISIDNEECSYVNYQQRVMNSLKEYDAYHTTLYANDIIKNPVDSFNIIKNFYETGNEQKFDLQKYSHLDVYVSYEKMIDGVPASSQPLPIDIKYITPDEVAVIDIELLMATEHNFSNSFFVTESNGKFVCQRVPEKMSKSKKNVVNPDDVIEKYGADCFRMFEMFLGPIEQSKPWDDKGISGVSNFLKKFWRLFYDDKGWKVKDEEPTAAEYKILHKTIKKIAEDIERLNFNTSVSAFMIATNELTSLNCHKKKILEPLVVVLAPFAPFITEELWSAFGHSTSVHTANYPTLEEKYLTESSFNYAVSINGKVRAEINLPLDLPETEVRKQVLALDKIQQYTNGAEPKKFIFVKGKIINVVV